MRRTQSANTSSIMDMCRGLASTALALFILLGLLLSQARRLFVSLLTLVL